MVQPGCYPAQDHRLKCKAHLVMSEERGLHTCTQRIAEVQWQVGDVCGTLSVWPWSIAAHKRLIHMNMKEHGGAVAGAVAAVCPVFSVKSISIFLGERVSIPCASVLMEV